MANYIPLVNKAVKPDKQFESLGGPGQVYLPDSTKYTGVAGTEQNVGQYIESGIGGKVYGQYKDASGNTFKLNPDSTGGYSQPTGSFEQLSGNPAQGSTTVSPTEYMKTHRDLLPGNTPEGQSFQGYNASTPTYDPTKGPQYDYGKGPTDIPPNGLNGLTPNATTPGAAPNTPAGNAYSEQNSAYLQNIAKTNPQLAGQLADSLNYTAADRAKLGLEAAKASGAPAPTSIGDGMAGTKGYMPPQQNPTVVEAQKKATELVQQDAAIQKLNEDYKLAISKATTETNFNAQYDQIKSQLGLPNIDTQMLNIENVINGTEQNIRDEVAKAGGFATDSQILALAATRNKVLVNKYNSLVSQRSMLMDELKTKIGLSKDERDYAMKLLDMQLDYDQKQVDYTTKMVSNAKEGFNNVVKFVGYDGLYASTGNDPQAISNVEQVLGLAPGGLTNLAQQAAQERAREQMMNDLELQSKQLGVKNQQAQLDQIPLENQIKNAQLKNTQANTAQTYQKMALDKAGAGSGLSSQTQAVINNPSLFNDLTPTARGNVISQLQANGYNTSNLGTKALSDPAIKNISDTQKALDDLSGLRKIVETNQDRIGPIAGLEKINPWSKSRQVQADIDRVRQTVGKALEGGVLRKEDEEKYKKILATMLDTPETALYKIDALASSITRNIEDYKALQGQGGRSLDVKESLTKQGVTPVQDLRTKYNY